MERWLVSFQENGGEYTGYMCIFAKKVMRIDEKTIKADGVKIHMDEVIEGIEQWSMNSEEKDPWVVMGSKPRH